MERFHYENGERRSKTQWTADILHNLESLLQEWDSTRTQQRRLQASPNLSLDFSKMFDSWGNIKALHWNLKSVDVAAMLRCSQVRSKMLSPQSLCLWWVLSLFNSWHFLDLLPLKVSMDRKLQTCQHRFDVRRYYVESCWNSCWSAMSKETTKFAGEMYTEIGKTWESNLGIWPSVQTSFSTFF